MSYVQTGITPREGRLATESGVPVSSSDPDREATEAALREIDDVKAIEALALVMLDELRALGSTTTAQQLRSAFIAKYKGL